jgi:hypothetical protein
MKNSKKQSIALIESLSNDQRERTLQFDDDPANTCQLSEFLYTNLLDEQVNSIMLDDAQRVIGLSVGEELYLPYGFGTKIKRLT